ncbi:MAG: acetyl-CoA carboxylase carboxyltransferase subunit alpha [Gammaproteobacteria bacterium]
MRSHFLEFERPIADLEAKLEELRLVEGERSINIQDEILRLEKKIRDYTLKTFKNLSDWQIVQLARHPQRPYALDYMERLFTEFDELHGDRAFSDDKAIVGGLAYLGDKKRPVMVIGQQKGRDTKEKIARNFGMPHPEGYRKALRLAKLAERFKLPIITFIDTPGAYPGIGAEARGQSEAIARNLLEFSELKVPVICVMIGEGCSGGALGIGVGDRVLMLEYAYYATISPEGCATILWKSAEKAAEAAQIMGITASKLKQLKIIDDIIEEPLGGAHRDYEDMSNRLKKALIAHLDQLSALSLEELLETRYKKFTSHGIPVV